MKDSGTTGDERLADQLRTVMQDFTAGWNASDMSTLDDVLEFPTADDRLRFLDSFDPVVQLGQPFVRSVERRGDLADALVDQTLDGNPFFRTVHFRLRDHKWRISLGSERTIIR